MAGSVTMTLNKISTKLSGKGANYSGAHDIFKLLIEWVGDASGGTVPQTAFSASDLKFLRGRYCVLAVTDPGSTAPTDNYDITIEDEYGVDVFGGSLTNRDTANSEQAIPQIGTGLASRLCGGTWTFKLSGNSVNSATGKLCLYFEI